MPQFRKHIAAILLLNFLMPQLLGSLHYLLVAHDLPYKQKGGYTTADPGMQEHSCHYHLQSPSGLTSAEETAQRFLPEYFPAQQSFGGLRHYVHQPEYSFRLRGPPPGPFFWN